MRTGTLALLLALSTAATAEAQTGKHFSVGAGIGFQDYSDARFSSKDLDITPMYRFTKGGSGEPGWSWDMKTSIGFSNLDVPADIGGAEVRLGRLRTIPLLLGLARNYRQGPVKIGAWVTGGPSFNNLEIDRGARETYAAAGSTLEGIHAKTSWAVRPGVSATYNLSPWVGLQGSASYTINRPTVVTGIDGTSTSETWKLDHSSATVGLVMGIF